jgi:hypothetical protein
MQKGYLGTGTKINSAFLSYSYIPQFPAEGVTNDLFFLAYQLCGTRINATDLGSGSRYPDSGSRILIPVPGLRVRDLTHPTSDLGSEPHLFFFLLSPDSGSALKKK